MGTAVVVRFGRTVVVLQPRDRCALGRGAPTRPVDVRLSASIDLSRHAASVLHHDDGRWAVEALSTTNGVSVRHPGGSSIRVAVGTELAMPDWFSDAYLVVTTASAEYEARVTVGPAHATGTGAGAPSRLVSAADDASTRLVLPRDLGRADYRTALILGEPMLEDPFNTRLPTEGQIAARLVELGLEQEGIGARTVERRLARLRDRLEVGSNAELRDRVVAAAIVTRDDLDRARRAGS